MSDIPTSDQILEFMNSDLRRLTRLIQNQPALSDKSRSEWIEGPRICIKATWIAFFTSYLEAIAEIKIRLHGRKIKQMLVTAIEDSDEEFWRDWAQHLIRVQ